MKIFRVEDGVRIPYIIELDQELTVMAEYADRTVQKHVSDGRRSHRKPRVPDSPQRKVSLIMNRWVTEAIEENPIPGTDDLRDEYFRKRTELHEEAAREGRDCPPCELSKLMRRYRETLTEKGYFSDIANMEIY